jgi:DNA replicative helicase MCM subunit Mcm2 (Cdc46/Mcm family)
MKESSESERINSELRKIKINFYNIVVNSIINLINNNFDKNGNLIITEKNKHDLIFSKNNNNCALIISYREIIKYIKLFCVKKNIDYLPILNQFHINLVEDYHKMIDFIESNVKEELKTKTQHKNPKLIIKDCGLKVSLRDISCKLHKGQCIRVPAMMIKKNVDAYTIGYKCSVTCNKCGKKVYQYLNINQGKPVKIIEHSCVDGEPSPIKFDNKVIEYHYIDILRCEVQETNEQKKNLKDSVMVMEAYANERMIQLGITENLNVGQTMELTCIVRAISKSANSVDEIPILEIIYATTEVSKKSILDLKRKEYIIDKLKTEKEFLALLPSYMVYNLHGYDDLALLFILTRILHEYWNYHHKTDSDVANNFQEYLIHILIAGDYGTGKTIFLKKCNDVCDIAPFQPNMIAGFSHSYAKLLGGMTGLDARKRRKIESGTLSNSSGSVLLVDEIDKMIKTGHGAEIIGSLNVALSEGKFKIGRMSEEREFKADTQLIATCNPKNGKFKSNNSGEYSILDGLDYIDESLLNRFFPVVVLNDDSPESRLKINQKSNLGHYPELIKRYEISINNLKLLIKYLPLKKVKVDYKMWEDWYSKFDKLIYENMKKLPDNLIDKEIFKILRETRTKNRILALSRAMCMWETGYTDEEFYTLKVEHLEKTKNLIIRLYSNVIYKFDIEKLQKLNISKLNVENIEEISKEIMFDGELDFSKRKEGTKKSMQTIQNAIIREMREIESVEHIRQINADDLIDTVAKKNKFDLSNIEKAFELLNKDGLIIQQGSNLVVLNKKLAKGRGTTYDRDE